MRSLEHANLLMRKAAQDEFVAKLLLANPDSPDEAIGFHEDEERLDRPWAVACIRRTRQWAESLIREKT
jgi:hypothetical protein